MATESRLAFLETVITLMGQRVVTMLHGQFLKTSFRQEYVRLLSNADEEISLRVGRFFYHCVQSSDPFAADFAAQLPDEFESIFWPVIRSRLMFVAECEVPAFGFFSLPDESLKTRVLNKIDFQVRTDFVRKQLVTASSDPETGQIIKLVDRVLEPTWNYYRELPPSQNLPSRQAMASRLLERWREALKDVDEFWSAQRSEKIRSATPGTYLWLQSHGIAYASYYCYLGALSLSLLQSNLFTVEAFGSFVLRDSKIEFTPNENLLKMLSANLPPSNLRNVAV